MAPNLIDTHNITNIEESTKPRRTEKWPIVWRNVVLFLFLHFFSALGMYFAFTRAGLKTWIWTYLLALFSTQGTGAGVHRLWAHRTYKAKLPLRIILGVFQTMCLQNHIYEWCRDHRGHHKYADTDADPHNAKRGFFFSHMGWLLVRKHEEVIAKGKTLDLSDLEADPVVMFQKKYYVILAPLFAFIIPTVVPWYFWNEDLFLSFCMCAMLRYSLSLHGTWLVNSAAHMYGNKPYDDTIMATQNAMVSYITNGEGWHNYHHVFPWDYRASELGSYSGNWSTAFIDFFARVGWAYDLKTVSEGIVRKRILRTGDGTGQAEDLFNRNVWGVEDKDMKEEDVCLVEVRNRKSG